MMKKILYTSMLMAALFICNSSFAQAIVGENYVFLDVENMEKYGSDETEDLQFFPEVIVKPVTPTEISQILILANEYHIPVTPQGARTGLSGGALPVYGGIALSMERFNKILFLDMELILKLF